MHSQLLEAVVQGHLSLTDRVVRMGIIIALFGMVIGYVIFAFPSRNVDPASSLDFSGFYCAGLMLRQGLGQHLYDGAAQARCLSSESPPGIVYYLRPPFESLLFIPLSYLQYRWAYLVWTLANVLMLIISAHFIDRLTAASSTIAHYLKIRGDHGLLLGLFVTCAPFTTSLLLGQDAGLTLLIYTLVFVLLIRKLEIRAGLVLGCALFKFQLVVPIALFLLLRRKWSALAGLSISGAIMALISVALCGRPVLGEYPRFLLIAGPYHNLLGLDPLYMPNIRGLLTLMLGHVSSPTGITVVTLAISLLLLCWAARFWNDNQPERSLGVALLASLLSTYHLHNYDFTLLLLAVPMVWSERLSRTAKWAVLSLFIPPLHLFLISHGVYALMLFPVAAVLQGAISVLRTEEASASSS